MAGDSWQIGERWEGEVIDSHIDGGNLLWPTSEEGDPCLASRIDDRVLLQVGEEEEGPCLAR